MIRSGSLLRRIRKQIRCQSNANRSWRPAPHRSACFYHIQQRPIALLELMSPRERCARFQIERLQHTIVAIVALKDDAAQRCCCYTAGCTELSYNSVAFRGIQHGQRLSRKTRELIERGSNCRSISTESCNDVGLDRHVVSAGHTEFHACGDHYARDRAQIVTLRCGELIVRMHERLNQRGWRGAASSDRRCRARWPGWWRSD